MTDPSFMARPIDTVTKTALNPVFGDVDKTTAMDAGVSLATRPDVVMTPEIDTFRQDIANKRGITALPKVKPFNESINNQEIAVGTSKGTDLSFDPFSSPENFQRAKELGIINEFGLTATEQANVSDIFRKEGEEKRKADETRKQLSQSIDTTGLASIPVIQQKYADVTKEISNLTAKGPVAEGTPEYNKALKLAEKENELRNIIELQNRVGLRQNLFSDIVNLAPNPRGEGFVLENRAVSGETITDEKINNIIKEYADVGINLSEGEANTILSARGPMGKIGVNFRQLPPNLQEQFFLNTNLDYGRSIPTPINVVY